MSKKALIIDSDIELIEQLQDAAQRLGLDAETTTNGNEGVDLASLDQPAVVFLGLMDTKGAGYGLCSKLRRRAPTVPVIMVIDREEEGSERLERHQALKTSADAYLVRPFTMERLAQTIDRLVPGVVEFPTDPEEIIGETAIVPNDSLLGGSLFNDDELRELEKEAEQAFSSIVVDPVPMGGSREFEVDDLDLVGADPLVAEPVTGGGIARMDDGTQVFDLAAAGFDSPVTPAPAPLLPSDSGEISEIAPPPSVASGAGAADIADSFEFAVEEDDPPSEPPPTPPVPLTRTETARDRAVAEAEDQAHEVAQIERENRSLRARVSELEHGIRMAREDVARREADVSTQRTSDSAAKRELIEVREDLNRREREVLELRDRLTSKDRQLVDLGDQLDSLRTDKERAEADVRAAESRASVAQQAREEAEREIENFRVRLSETRVRLDRAKEEAEKTYDEIKQIQRKAAQDLQAAKESAAQAAAEAEDQFNLRLAGAEARLANVQQAAESGRLYAARQLEEAKAEHERASTERSAAHATALAEAEAAHATARTQQEARHAQALADAQAAHEAAQAEQKSLHDTAMAGSRRAYDEEIGGLRDEITTLEQDLESQAEAHKTAVERLQAESASTLEGQRKAHDKELSLVRDEAQARIADLSGQLAAQSSRAEAAEAEGRRLGEELTASQSLLDEESTRFNAAEAALKAALEAEKKGRADDVAERDARIVDVVGQNEAQAKRIGEQDSAIESLSDELANSENEVAARTRDIAQLTSTITGLDAQVADLQGQLADTRGNVDKARTALAVAQAFLDRATPAEATVAQAE
jgi:CheY-like chemotaxis protein/chromosome segregation ATPase